jgi:spermidine synthase
MTAEGSGGPRPLEVALLASVFVVAACGLVYELAAGALASYVLGDSVLQFSTIIGTYLFAMGVGSYLSRFFERQLPAHFLRIELLVALVGGSLPAMLIYSKRHLPGALSDCCCTGWCWWLARWWGWRFRW